MASHNITESAKLVDVSRRTIQRYIKTGRLSYKNNNQGNPEIDTSELIREFGNVSHPVTPPLSQHVTVTKDELLAIIEQAAKKANQPLIEEIKQLKKEVQSMRMITYQGEQPKVKTVNSSTNTKEENSYIDDIPSLDDYLSNK